MSEKRYNVWDIDGTIFLEDHKEGSYHIGQVENVDINCLNDIANRLNDLTKENEQLQKKNDNLVNMIARVQYRADLIKEENEQLQTQLSQLAKSNREGVAKVQSLAKENEKLKKILNELSDMLQFDVENGIRSYPVKLSEYLNNALKELQE